VVKNAGAVEESGNGADPRWTGRIAQPGERPALFLPRSLINRGHDRRENPRDDAARSGAGISGDGISAKMKRMVID